jgi:arylsulfatase A
VLNEFAIDFIRRHKQQPFFIYYPTPLIHGPILRTPDSQQPDAKGSHYADNIAYMDKLIGQLVAELETLKLREKTLIVFTGDNGSVPVGTVGGRPVDGKKNTMLEGGSRVPLIANWPAATPAGVVRKDLIDFSDLLPTFAELAGVKPSDGRAIDGHSFAPQLRGEQGQPREWAYVHLRDDRYVRSERWKLTGKGELFDMRDAPHRQIPVAADTKDADAQAARAQLQKALDHLAAEAAKEGLPPGKKKGKK